MYTYIYDSSNLLLIIEKLCLAHNGVSFEFKEFSSIAYNFCCCWFIVNSIRAFKDIFHFMECVIVQWRHFISIMSIVIMSDTTIKLFQSVREYYQMLGISKQNYSFNWRSFIVFSIILLDFIATATYFLFKTNINVDYAETLQSFYFSSTEFNFLVAFAVNFWKMSNIFMLFESLEKTIQKS